MKEERARARTSEGQNKRGTGEGPDYEERARARIMRNGRGLELETSGQVRGDGHGTPDQGKTGMVCFCHPRAGSLTVR